MYSCPCCQPTQTTINHYLARHYSARLGLGLVERCSSKRATSSACLPCAPSPSLLSSSLIRIFSQCANSRKENHKNESRGHKNELCRTSLGKIIFGYTPRVVLPPQQPVSNATMEQVKRWGDDGCNLGTLKKSSDFSSV